jgi:acyl-CoA reductase-like NAD-dependent aldehyde dehydrogenase
MLPEAKLYVDGALRRVAGGKTYDDIGPWTGDGDLPFGGYKVSGVGRERGIEAIEEYLETKTVAYRM